MARLTGKTCLVTGAARGIGEAIVRAFIDEGAQVYLTDIDRQAGKAVAKDIGCQFLPLDVSVEGDWARIADEVPVLDVLVNNAGITGFEHGMTAHDPENDEDVDGHRYRELDREEADDGPSQIHQCPKLHAHE